MVEQERRIKKLPIHMESLLSGLFTPTKDNRWMKIDEGVPEDARFLKMWHDQSRDSYYLIFCHDEWNQISFEENIPEINLQVTTKEEPSKWICLHCGFEFWIDYYSEASIENRVKCPDCGNENCNMEDKNNE